MPIMAERYNFMKCNMNKTTNNMANVYGPEFDMSTEEIINTIRKIVKLETIDQTFNPIDVEILCITMIIM